MSQRRDKIFIDLIQEGLYLCLENYYENCTLNCQDNYQNDHERIRVDKLLKPHIHNGEKISVCIKFNENINVSMYTEFIKTIEIIKQFQLLEWHLEFSWYKCINYDYSGYDPLILALLEIQIYESIPMYKPLFRKRRPKKRRKNTAYQSWGTFYTIAHLKRFAKTFEK